MKITYTLSQDEIQEALCKVYRRFDPGGVEFAQDKEGNVTAYLTTDAEPKRKNKKYFTK